MNENEHEIFDENCAREGGVAYFPAQFHIEIPESASPEAKKMADIYNIATEFALGDEAAWVAPTGETGH